MTIAMLVLWVLAGVLVAGGLAALVLQRGGYGRVTDIVLALSGAFVGSLGFRILGIAPDAGLFAVAVAAFAGAAGVIVAQRKIWPAIV